MSVIGFDIGNESCVIAAAKRGGIDVLLNDESKRETPSVVSFADKQRFLGSSAAAFATCNPKTTVSHIKSLIGKQYKEVHDLLKLLPFITTDAPRGGGVLIQLEYMKTIWSFTPVEILGMLFKHLKHITEKDLHAPVVDCVIGIPSYFTDSQRREYLDAASIAGLKPLRLLHDGTAIALGYGMYKTDLSNSGPTIVMFVDVGHCDTQVTVAAFQHGKMKILAHTFDQNLGGRDFDEVLYTHFAAEFKNKYKIDVGNNARACMRLRASCEKVKRVLSANTEALVSIECLIGDTDVRGVVTREDFESLSVKLLERVTVPCVVALIECGLSADKISSVELVGSGSRIPAITRVLTSLFQKEPSRTLNASECVARGCALFCAMLSPTLQVRDYKVQDSFPYSIVLPLQNHEMVLFPKGSPFPKEEIFTCTGSAEFSFQVIYSNETDFPAGISRIVGCFWIGRSEPSLAEDVKVDFGVLLNDHGIIEIGFARMMFHGRMLNLPFSENLYVTATCDELHEAQKKENILAEQDLKVERIKDQRNTLESFVYDTRSKLSSAYKSFGTDSEKEVIFYSLKETEDWLYEDSDDESEQDYAGKLKNLKKLLEPIENKYQESIRAEADKALQATIATYRLFADSLPASNKKMVKHQCNRAEQWLNSLNHHISPTTLTTYINNVIKRLERNCKDMMRSKPALSRNDEPVDSVQRHQHVVSDKGEQPVESDQREQQPTGPDQSEQPVVPNQRGQPIDSDETRVSATKPCKSKTKSC